MFSPTAVTPRKSKSGFNRRPNVWLAPLHSLHRHHPLMASVAFAMGCLWFIIATICGPDDLALRRAELAVNSGRYAHAAALLKDELNRQPGNKHVSMRLADAMIHLGQFTEARRVLDAIDPARTAVNTIAFPLRYRLLLSELRCIQQSSTCGTEIETDIDTVLTESAAVARALSAARTTQRQAEGLLLQAYKAEAQRAITPLNRSAVEPATSGRHSLREYLRMMPDDSNARLMLIRIELREGTIQDAMAEFEYLASQPVLPLQIGTNAAQLAMRLSDDELGRWMAHRVLHKVALNEREQPQWLRTRAALSLENNQAEAAYELLAAIEWDKPEHAQRENRVTLALLARAAYESGRYEAAKKTLKRLLSERPDDLTSLHLLGVTYLALKEYDQADRVLHAARAHELADSRIDRSLLALHRARKTLRSAGDLVRGYFERHPDDPDAMAFMFSLLRESGDENGIRTLLATIDSLAEVEYEHFVLLLDGYLYLEELERTARLAHQLIQRYPDQMDGYLSLAEATYRRGDPHEAGRMIDDVMQRFGDGERLEELSRRYRQGNANNSRRTPSPFAAPESQGASAKPHE